jgi:membrane protease YdiL (CAAX protease family)
MAPRDMPSPAVSPAPPFQPRPRRRRKPRVWPTYVFALFIIFYPFVIGVGVAIVVLIIGVARHLSEADMKATFQNARLMLALTAVMMVINIALVPLFQWISRYLKPHLPLFRRPRAGWVSIGVLSFGAMAIAMLTSETLSLLHLPSQSLESITQMLSDTRQMPPIVFQLPLLPLLLIGFIGPFVEEVVFRGVIQSHLVRRHGPWWGILITSLFFGIYHWDLGQGLLAVIIGVYLGYMAYRTRSIWPSILAHMLVNTSSSILVLKEIEIPEGAYAAALALTFLLVSAIAIIVLIRVPHLRRARQPAP